MKLTIVSRALALSLGCALCLSARQDPPGAPDPFDRLMKGEPLYR